MKKAEKLERITDLKKMIRELTKDLQKCEEKNREQLIELERLHEIKVQEMIDVAAKIQADNETHSQKEKKGFWARLMG